MDKVQYKISVRNLVEFILASGDIDNRMGGMPDKEAMQMGSRMHRKIQKSMGGTYRMEVPLSVVLSYDDFDITVEGRADGIFEDDIHETISGKDKASENENLIPTASDNLEKPQNIVKSCATIDEIKGIFKDPDKLEEPKSVHLAQAKCYAYIYAAQNDLEFINVQMTYVHLENERIRRFVFSYTQSELDIWFHDLMDSYYPWVKFKYDWQLKRNRSIHELEFPYPYREGQRDAAAGVYRTIEHGKKLFLMAPTGVGKTLATVYPSIKAMGEGMGESIFYLTAKTITRTAASKAYDLLRNKGLMFKTLEITAKDKICFCEETDCNPDSCPYAKGHYDRINNAVYDLLINEDRCDRNTIEAYAHKYMVCPFEMSLDISLWVDSVICDYNYLFDPNASLRRFFSDGVKGDYIFLIDEAHNLVDRARNMYSASLYKEDFLEIKRKIDDNSPSIIKKLSACNKILLEYKKECESYSILNNIGNFAVKLLNLFSALDEYLDELPQGELRKDVLDFYFKIREFLYIFDLYDDKYVIYTTNDNKGFSINLFCVDPSTNLEGYLNKGRGTIFFSATLLPVEYYKKLLSTGNDDYTMYVSSPFSHENRFTGIIPDVTTKYTSRSRELYEKFADLILKCISIRTGNYMAFFPSYQFLENVSESLEMLMNSRNIKYTNVDNSVKDIINAEISASESMNNTWNDDQPTKNNENTTNIRIIKQIPGMSEAQKEKFLMEFESNKSEDLLLGLCVMSGSFAEGIDLTADSLIGALIVGTGLPMVCTERDILKRYFDDHGLNGFDYAYLYSGMNHVQQSAGRVIRTITDRGIVLLMDERFCRKEYMNLFPREWSNIEYITENNMALKIGEFWDQYNNM